MKRRRGKRIKQRNREGKERRDGVKVTKNSTLFSREVPKLLIVCGVVGVVSAVCVSPDITHPDIKSSV